MTTGKLRAPSGSISTRELTAKAKAFALQYGASAVGITTVDTLVGGPPSTNLEYVLPEARSAITLAVPTNRDAILDHLAKRSRSRHQKDYNRAGSLATGIAAQLASFIQQFGHRSIGVVSNEVYREDDTVTARMQHPDISHRLLAARGGVGWFGFSGNVLTQAHGPNVVLATTVTTMKLEPTEPLPPEDSYCDRCQSCNSACPSGFFRYGKKSKTKITMGGVEFTYSERRSYDRCNFVCAGYTGLHPNGKWSTWSPGRFDIPKEDADLGMAMPEVVSAWCKRPQPVGEALQQPLVYGMLREDVPLTCGNCMLVCHPEREERDRRLELLQNSGVVIQRDDGTLEAVSPEEAKAYIEGLDPEDRALFENQEEGARKGMEYLISRAKSIAEAD